MMEVAWDTRDFDKGIAKALPTMNDSASNAVEKAANELLKLSLLEVPVDTGLLKSTGKVSKGEKEGVVSYNTPYAVAVHERPSKKSKYLERPFKSNVGKFKNIISGEIKNNLK